MKNEPARVKQSHMRGAREGVKNWRGGKKVGEKKANHLTLPANWIWLSGVKFNSVIN